MSISPAQMTLQVAGAENALPGVRSSQAAIPAAIRPVEATADSPSSAPVVSPPANFSTDLKIDDQHQLYYEVVDNRTGDELFEIPPEALRKIGESLNVPLIGESGAHNVDVKS